MQRFAVIDVAQSRQGVSAGQGMVPQAGSSAGIWQWPVDEHWAQGPVQARSQQTEPVQWVEAQSLSPAQLS
ncbi:MAG TPA: hypothetical protein VFH68_09135, partial [Polyangia bacterium]|nr:hypothetical protein [Polyangia bacterium]